MQNNRCANDLYARCRLKWLQLIVYNIIVSRIVHRWFNESTSKYQFSCECFKSCKKSVTSNSFDFRPFFEPLFIRNSQIGVRILGISQWLSIYSKSHFNTDNAVNRREWHVFNQPIVHIEMNHGIIGTIRLKNRAKTNRTNGILWKTCQNV